MPEPDQVVMQLKWAHNPQFAGFYIAQEKGYYADENIAVTFVPGEPRSVFVDSVVAGETQFALSKGTHLLANRAEGQPVKAVATILQISPICYFSLAETGINEPADLAGKRIGIGKHDLVLPGVLHTAGLTLNDVDLLPFGSDLTPLLTGELDAQSGYLTGDVVTLREQGYQVNVILPDDYGVRLYSDVLFTSEGLIEKYPDLVRRFVRASLWGWEYAVAHPDEALEATLKFDPSLDRTYNQALMDAFVPLVDIGLVPVGMMEQAVWQATQDILLEHKIITSPVDLEALYTNKFVQE